MFLITVIAVIMFATLVTILNQKLGIEVIDSGRTPFGHFGSNVSYVITIITSQGNFWINRSWHAISPTVYLNFDLLSGNYLPNKKLSVRMLTGIWCLMAVVLINSYTGNLTSYLSVPRLNPIPNSFDELADSSDYKLSIAANTVLMKLIMVKMCVTNHNF